MRMTQVVVIPTGAGAVSILSKWLWPSPFAVFSGMRSGSHPEHQEMYIVALTVSLSSCPPGPSIARHMIIPSGVAEVTACIE